VIATQNPVEQDGTYRLPESQMDRFMIRMSIGYPDHDAEMEILDGTSGPVSIEPVAGAQEVSAMMRAAGHVRMVSPLKAYLVDLAHASRRHPALRLGLSPRATVQLARAARTLAASRGRDFATPDDVKELAEPTLAHRLSVRHDFAARGVTAAEVIAEILATVPVPSGR
ncbi:MAG: AAA family ATPase, partial [Actinomycetota bacterium]